MSLTKEDLHQIKGVVDTSIAEQVRPIVEQAVSKEVDGLALMMKKSFDHVDEQFAEVKHDVAELKSDVAELKGDVSELKLDMKDVKFKLADTVQRSEFHGLQFRVEQLEKKNA